MTRPWARLPPAALALLSAALVALSALPGPWGWLACVALTPLMAALDREARATRLPLWTAAVGASLAAVGAAGVYRLAPPLFWQLVAGQALLFALPGGLLALTTRTAGPAPSALLLLAWTATETLGSSRQLFGELASPLALGYLLAGTPLIRAAGWSGVSGLSWLLLGLNLALYRGLGGRWFPALGIGAVGAAALLAPLGVSATGTLPLALVQGASSERELRLAGTDQPRRRQLLARYARLSRRAGAGNLVVWPESSLPGVLAGPGDAAWLSPFLPETAAVVAGVAFVGGRHLSSLFHWDGERLERIYDKRVPVPRFEAWLQPGSRPNLARLEGAPLGLLICWESALPGLARAAVREGARALLVASNDTALGASTTAHWHVQATRVRAAETGRALALASQSGPSMLIAADGRVLAATRPGERTVLRGALPLTAGTTPFVRYGNWLGWLCLALIGASLVRARPPRRS